MENSIPTLDTYCSDVACAPEHPCPRCDTVPMPRQTMAEVVYGERFQCRCCRACT